MWCTECGAALVGDARYCRVCGARVRLSERSGELTPHCSDSQDRQYRGLRGWLALVGLGLLASPVVLLVLAYQTAVLFSDGTVRLLSDPSTGVRVPGYSAALRFELLSQTLFGLSYAYLLCLYFLKSRFFPKAYIALSVLLMIFYAADYSIVNALAEGAGELKEVFVQQLNETSTELIRVLPGTLLWVAYMLKSKRVRATFIE